MNEKEKKSLIKKLQNRKTDIKKVMQLEYDTITEFGIEGIDVVLKATGVLSYKNIYH